MQEKPLQAATAHYWNFAILFFYFVKCSNAEAPVISNCETKQKAFEESVTLSLQHPTRSIMYCKSKRAVLWILYEPQHRAPISIIIMSSIIFYLTYPPVSVRHLPCVCVCVSAQEHRVFSPLSSCLLGNGGLLLAMCISGPVELACHLRCRTPCGQLTSTLQMAICKLH